MSLDERFQRFDAVNAVLCLQGFRLHASAVISESEINQYVAEQRAVLGGVRLVTDIQSLDNDRYKVSVYFKR